MHALNPLVQGQNHTLSLINDRTEKSWHKSNGKQTFIIKTLVTAAVIAFDPLVRQRTYLLREVIKVLHRICTQDDAVLCFMCSKTREALDNNIFTWKYNVTEMLCNHSPLKQAVGPREALTRRLIFLWLFFLASVCVALEASEEVKY